ncbi:MAG TPA: YciI family protein [Bacteroidia bacterium]
MKKNLFTFILLFTVLFIYAQKENPLYNKSLADSLGADDYGMKNYVFVILKTGPADKTIKNKTVRDSLFAGHMANIERLAKEGKLTVAGPFGKNDKKYRGLFILNVKTIEEAKVLLDTDPTIKLKIFDVEMVPWYGSAALPMYLPYSEKVGKNSF